tara:strand:- start:63 stop:398 length:336 start_codon:yes stop_codon:yes gene_type:complete
MATTTEYQVVTANRLLDGDVVFLTKAATWNPSIDQAAVATIPDEADRLLAVAERQQNAIVGPYAVSVSVDADGHPMPTHYRERIRLLGPTNRTDLGRQAWGPREVRHVPLR